MSATRTESGTDSIAGDPALTPVAVTRWTARLVDPRCELDYLRHRLEDDRRRVLILTGLVALAGILNFLVNYFGSPEVQAATLLATFATIVMPAVAFCIALRLRSPQMLQVLMLSAVIVGMVMRLGILTIRPDTADVWTTLMVGIVFVIYLSLSADPSDAVGRAGDCLFLRGAVLVVPCGRRRFVGQPVL